MSLQTLLATCLGERDALTLARQQAPAWEGWLLPVSTQSPAGQDPGYDDDFQRMREEVNKLSGADVDRVIQLAEKLLKHTCKDLRVVTYYLWARLQKDGEAGLADGLNLLAAVVEQYGVDVFPARPNSRKMALEWLASNKVLDSLSLYPEVVTADAERIVAALAWLARSLDNWPQEQRPELGALYTALSARLTLPGGSHTQAPPHNASHEISGQAAAPTVASVKSARDLLDSGRALASYLREQPQGWLAAHRLMKSLRWDTVHRAPPQEAGGNTRLMPPRGDYRAHLKRLLVQQSWSELLDQIERMYAEGVNHFWLDLQWYLYQALSKQPAPLDRWADVVKSDLGIFLARLPGLEALSWSDGTPFADETTREWIAQHFSGNRLEQRTPESAMLSSTADTDVAALEAEAMVKAEGESVEQALAWLASQPGAGHGRQRWWIRLLMARVAEHHGRSDLALHLLTELDGTAHQQTLAQWEPELSFEVKARLLKLLRMKYPRSDADKPTLAGRMETLLADLVAIDPVRAVVLCA
ncbi:type VI secretion system protein TssA [Pseudomonas huanghezhanensis]|uniref:type VI secretion system protein TssA n=1 Tax=Pseudomonas huanghezhanensis TaxID=3002903 RepID=UPI0022867BE9|nr:type VI secretion system protein TssA [Pseudomonas sp. BSw22131]